MQYTGKYKRIYVHFCLFVEIDKHKFRFLININFVFYVEYVQIYGSCTDLTQKNWNTFLEDDINCYRVLNFFIFL